jgi:hypothetical protein
MADILRPDRSPVTAAAVLPDHHRVMARVAVLQDRRRVRVQVGVLQDRRRVKAVVVLQGNLAAVGDLQDHHPVMATEEVTAVAVMAGAGAGAEGAATVVVGKVVATTSSRTVSRNFSPASGSAPLRRQQRRAATEASRVSRHLRPHDPP